ncbi:MAG: Na+/H+ antiporter subunit D [Candidatus Hydrogenedentes bacterium]|nr:Na+/H+ antiporter subunit D [Candidatus Hydrogenedentota bacterium]
MVNLVLVLPLLVPFFTGTLCLLSLGNRRAQRWLAAGGALSLVAASSALLYVVATRGICAAGLGNWPPPFGIAIVADSFSAILVLVSAIMTFAVIIYSRAGIDSHRVGLGYYPLLFFLLLGVNGSFLTGDLFNLYVWFEVMLIASFVLMVLGGEREQIEGAVKYVTLNLVASVIFLSASGILYGKVKTLNLADLSRLLYGIEEAPVITGLALLFITSFGIKAALFPLYFWLPASYHTPPIAITTLFAALLTKVGVYAIARVSILVFHESAVVQQVLLVIAALTMISGVLGAVAQYDIRRLLSFHIISQIGYLIMGIAIGTTATLAAMIYFMVHVIFAKSALFIVAGILHSRYGTFNLRNLGGAYGRRTVLAAGFLIPALSLAGMPPLSGFVGKFALVRGGLESEHYWMVAIALGVSVLTLFSMIKIWNEAFWKPAPADREELPAISPAMYLPLAGLGGVMILMGLAAEPVYLFAEAAAAQLLNRAGYIEAVLGVRP